ncbi:TadE/TadG family type IV pilus assembly protein [uncultured Phycicoccus sp.]|uniref:TadE/TadG family type IV pilus assembly protein n=1 Tax=uncultured Phycicoccus sp. TaxID=661422 RepID=UPI00261CEDC8|nr:TadE/TadG family type IV pilus assembly protein [uncultured Phycicoccus sp.]
MISRRGRCTPHHTPTSGPRRAAERGASAVEFALVLPALILVLGAIIDFGFVFSQQIAMNTAARDASRSGVTSSLSGSGTTCSAIATKARDGAALGGIGLNKTNVAVTVTGQGGTCTLAAGSGSAGGAATSTPCTGSGAPSATKTNLSVTLSYASSPPFPVPFMGTMNLTTKGDFECEYT